MQGDDNSSSSGHQKDGKDGKDGKGSKMSKEAATDAGRLISTEDREVGDVDRRVYLRWAQVRCMHACIR